MSLGGCAAADYEYFVWDDHIIIVDPNNYEIVDVLIIAQGRRFGNAVGAGQTLRPILIASHGSGVCHLQKIPHLALGAVDSFVIN